MALVAALAPVGSQAAIVTYSLPDVLTFGDYLESNVAATYAGDGFGGMYNAAAMGAPEWAHLFGVELTDYSRTIMQVGIGGLSGQTILSATLSFKLLDGGLGPHDLTLTGFDGGSGNLAYQWDAPVTNYGTAGTTAFNGDNSIDVTALLAASVGAGDTFFGMHLQGADASDLLWTYTYTGFDYGPDRAEVRLTVETAVVPQPASLVLFGVGFALAALVRRRG